jgi:hypothetical protein
MSSTGEKPWRSTRLVVRHSSDVPWLTPAQMAAFMSDEGFAVSAEQEELDDLDAATEQMRTQLLSDPPSNLWALRVRYAPNQVLEPHSHAARSVCFILSGSLTVGRETLAEGDLYSAAAHQVYGPLTVGPDGADVLNVFGSTDVAPGYFPVQGWRDRVSTNRTNKS